jgi:flagellar export protein FliJ
MKKFKWRLQRVLDLRGNQEQILKGQVSEITSKIAFTQGRIMAQKIKLQNLLKDKTYTSIKGRLSEHELFMKSIAHNDQAIKKLNTVLNILKNEYTIKMNELLELRKFRQALEKLREKAQHDYIKQQELAQQQQLDERTTIEFARRRIPQETTQQNWR